MRTHTFSLQKVSVILSAAWFALAAVAIVGEWFGKYFLMYATDVVLIAVTAAWLICHGLSHDSPHSAIQAITTAAKFMVCGILIAIAVMGCYIQRDRQRQDEAESFKQAAASYYTQEQHFILSERRDVIESVLRGKGTHPDDRARAYVDAVLFNKELANTQAQVQTGSAADSKYTEAILDIKPISLDGVFVTTSFKNAVMEDGTE